MKACDSFFESVLYVDLYRTPFLFLLADNKDKYRTYFGGCFSIITVILVLFYASFKFVNMTDLIDY